MSSYDKIVKGACKPKPAPPKSKYLDPIIAATWSDDGAVHDVCKALSPRLREPNTVVVFKALLVLHTMMRAGSTDNVLTCLSTQEVLRLKNVASGSWEGYRAPENLQSYAHYLDNRIRAYAELKHDPVRVQSESNRDMRVANNLGDQPERKQGSSSGPQRSKTIRKLRIMTVEKGLLRETKIVQKVVESVIRCRFYLDDLGDDLTVMALGMLVKDLLVLFQAVNEGVINVLEHYFEMSHVDAAEALDIYRQFCKQTEKVVEYLGVAKKLQNLLNVPIPNLKHAPVSLAGALEEYLNDPNFEQNRIEYRAQKEAADRSEARGSKPTATNSAPPPLPNASNGASSSTKESSSQQLTSPLITKPEGGAAIADFFSSIEEEQHTMFNPTTSSPSTAYFQQQAAQNPFHQRQSMMMTGGAFPPFTQPQQPQPTGFIQPQQTAFPMQPFQQPQMIGAPFNQQPTGAPAVFSQMRPQPTGFLQPQATGSNPFRQSMLMPQMTGMAAFGGSQIPPFNPAATPSAAQPQLQTQQTGVVSSSPFGQGQQQQQPLAGQVTGMPFGGMGGSTTGNNAFVPPVRPQSTPITSNPTSSFGQSLQGVKTHQTGSRNPFGQPTEIVPPVPQPPTIWEIATGSRPNETSSSPPTQPQRSLGAGGLSSAFGKASESTMASVASSFNVGVNRTTSSVGTNPTGSSSVLTDITFSAFSAQPTGTTATSSAFSSSLSPSGLQPQSTGFGGIKAFKPTSSFGASLLESMPTIPSQPATPNDQGPNGAPSVFGSNIGAQPTGMNGSALGSPSVMKATSGVNGIGSHPTGFNPSSLGSTGLGSQTTGFNPSGFGAASNPGSTVGVGLRPQMTGGAANPFRASMLAPQTTGPAFGASGGGGGPAPSIPPLPSFGSMGSLGVAFTGNPTAGGGNTPAPTLFANATGKPAGVFFGGSTVPPFSGSLSATTTTQTSPQQTGSLI